jgi:metal-responsive CopG/Arc/MetJ family transcriptional regulator
VVIAASVPETLATDLDSFAKAKGWSRSRAVTEALRGLLKRKSRT